MHQTTVRFGPDLWEALEAECSRLGVSAAQYVRESTLARMAYTAGRAGAPEYEAALAVATTASSGRTRRNLGLVTESAPAVRVPFGPGDSLRARAESTVEHSLEQESSASALGAESALILRRAQEIRAKSRELRAVAHQESR